MQFFDFPNCHAAILDFWNRKTLLANWVQRVEAHQHAKFRQNRSIGCLDIKIFRFFKMMTDRHLGFVSGIFGPPTVSTWGLYHSAKFGYDRCSSFIVWTFQYLACLAGKCQKWVFGQFDPLNGLQYQPKPKGWPLHDSASVEPSSVKIWWAFWPVGELLKKGCK